MASERERERERQREREERKEGGVEGREGVRGRDVRDYKKTKAETTILSEHMYACAWFLYISCNRACVCFPSFSLILSVLASICPSSPSLFTLFLSFPCFFPQRTAHLIHGGSIHTSHTHKAFRRVHTHTHKQPRTHTVLGILLLAASCFVERGEYFLLKRPDL